MSHLWIMLWKDWLRSLRNPAPWVVLLLLPLAVTFIMGSAFGGGGASDGNRPPLKIVVVDEDSKRAGDILRQIFGSGAGAGSSRLQLDILEMDQAREQFLKNRYNAMIVIPEGFVEALLQGRPLPAVRLIKNPAQSIYPSVVEDLVHSALQRLDRFRQPLSADISRLSTRLKSGGAPDALTLAGLFMRLSEDSGRMERTFLDPLVTVGERKDISDPESGASGITGSDADEADPIFAIVLPMMTSFFLFLCGESALRDLYRESESHTIQRYHSRFGGVIPMILSKSVFSFSLVAVCAGILVFGGGWLFGISWSRPWTALALCLAYAFFISGMMLFFVGLFGTEKRMQLWSNLIIFGMAFAGGSLITVSAMPGWIRDFLAPCLPNYWFISSMHSSQLARGSYSPSLALSLFLGLGLLLGWVAMFRIHALILTDRLRSSS